MIMQYLLSVKVGSPNACLLF